ncbi:MAG: hypothetical protein KA521_00685 [Crocinitomicaceae bacterium]|nr:hypothetical protein [Crocinitomicaceae bacterium]
MKKTILKLSFYTLILFSVASCGSSSEDTNNEMEIPEVVDEQVQDFSSLTTAKDAMDEYKNLLEEYSENVKNGDVEAANEIKTKLAELKTFAEGKFSSNDLKALVNLTSIAAQLEAGKLVDLNKAFNAYDQSMKVLENIPMDEDTKEAMEASKEAMQGLEGLSNF